MCTLALALIAAISVTTIHATPSGHMELRSNVAGFPLIGHLSFFDETSIGGKLRAELNLLNDTVIEPGVYYGYVHSRKDFTDGCDSTGPIAMQQTEDPDFSYPSAPANIVVSSPGGGPSDVTVNDNIRLTLTSSEEISIINSVIVFHTPEVVSLLTDRADIIMPGLHRTSKFCGFLYPKCIPREEL